MSYSSSDYSDLIQQFTFQQRPYITIADAMDSLYREFLNETGIPKSAVQALDFTVLKNDDNNIDSFRWVLGYNEDKFRNILDHKDVFKRLAPLVFEHSDKLKLDEYYRDVLLKDSYDDDIEFLTAVFHLTYSFNIPNAFNVGLIHKIHSQRFRQLRGPKMTDCNSYRATSCINEGIYDKAGLAALRIDEIEELMYQISDDQYDNFYKQYRAFFREWLDIILGGIHKEEKINYEHIHHLYFPIYDGVYPTQMSLRGYLAVYFNTTEYYKTAEDYFRKHSRIVQRIINDAYKKGTHHAIVENYEFQKRAGDQSPTIKYWKKHLRRLHRWKSLKTLREGSLDRIFKFDGKYCKLSMNELLDRKVIKKFVDEDLLDRNDRKVTWLELPSDASELKALNEQELQPFLDKRIKEIINLLDDILQKRMLLRDERMIQNAARKSGVAAVMARNMAHNVGSHVLSKYSREEDFDERLDNGGKCKKIASLLSYLRTRMDFLAALSTESTTLVTNLKIYRDAMSYFKPIEIDQEEITWQELLLDHISGIDVLKSSQLHIKYLRDGKELNLEVGDHDPSFASPNGLLGAHALYIILENIIRNSAKHAYNPSKNKTLEITFEIRESIATDTESLMEICVYDNLQNANNKPPHKSQAECETLVGYLNDRIDTSILEHDKLRETAWGVLEMKICAAYLRRISPEILDDEHALPLLKAINVDGNLGYCFYVQRPKELLIIDEEKSLGDLQAHQNDFRIQGVDIYNFEQLKNSLAQNVQHDFMVLINPSDKLLDVVSNTDTGKALPFRILTTNSSLEMYPYIPEAILKSFLHDRPKELHHLVLKLWELRISHNNRNIELLIRHNQEPVVKKWQINELATSTKDISYIEHLNPEKRYIIYDRHADIYHKNADYQQMLIDRYQEEKVASYECLQHGQPTCFVVDNAANNSEENRKTAYKMIETGLIRIAVLDERVQGIVADMDEGHCNSQSLWSLGNILIPSKRRVDLDNPRNQCPQLSQWMEEHFARVDFLVIHYGILEKIFEDNFDAIKAKLEWFEKKYPHINVTIISGRGLPQVLRKLNVRFIHYSQIARYLLEEKSKYHLCKILFAARRSV